MNLDFSSVEFDGFGRPEQPVLLLQTLDGTSIGTLSNVSAVKIAVKFSEPSELKFRINARSDGVETPYYKDIGGFKRIYTKHYGVYLVENPSEKSDGLETYQEITAYSIEKMLESKKFFLEEGTFNFWNPAAPDDTVIGRILEVAAGWSVGYVSPALIGRYRTFDSYDDYLLSFMYSSAPEKYRCVFVFNPYDMTFSVYDADEERPTLPIYLDFDNLVEELQVDELSDELVTALRPYGADELDIRSVNPTGTNWIYNLDYFIQNGDIASPIAEKWQAWEAEIAATREYYRGLVSLQATATASILAMQAVLTDLEGQLEDLTNQQSITIQALAQEVTETGKQQQQALLDEINAKIDAKKAEIEAQKQRINEVESQLDTENPNSYAAQIAAVVGRLSFSSYFTEEEQQSLQAYFIEQDLTEETFVASEINTSSSGATHTLSNASVSISNASIAKIDLTSQFGKSVYAISGGTISVGGQLIVSADIVRGTLETTSGGSMVMSIYAGEITSGDATAQSGLLTISGSFSGFSDDICEVTEDGIVSLQGTNLFFTAAGSLFLTQNAGEYQRYSVQMELFEYAEDVLSDVSSPTYEFDVDSGNFIFSKQFAPFREKLRLGDAVYLRLHSGEVITPILIEVELDFEEIDKLSLTFSNRFKRHDGVNTLKDMIESSYSSSRGFDAGKYIYNQTAGAMNKVTEFMNGSLDAAANTIYGASNQSVRIDGAGIHIGGDSDYQIRIINSMIALTDDNWNHAKIGIGLFSSPEIGSYFGVNADVIGGKLLVGNNLVIENTNDQGVMQFKVDSSGAWLYNSTFLLAKDSGGKLLLDPAYGFIAGSGNLYTVDGTTVRPSFVDSNGDIILDDEGFPKDANFYIDSRTGNAYFRGKVYATDGVFNGTVYATDGEFSGTIHATDGEFSGTIKAAILSGKITGDPSYGGAIEGVSLNIGNGAFTVDRDGNVVIQKGSISWGAVSGSADIDNRIENAQNSANSARNNISKLANGSYSGGTFINGTTISAPYINGGKITGIDIYGATFRNLDGTSYIKMNDGRFGQLDFYSSSTTGAPIFSIVDNIGTVEFQAYNNAFLSYMSGTGTYATGEWYFLGNVHGVTATFG